METFHFGNLLETFWNFPSPILEAWKFPLDRESFQILHWYIVLLLIIRYTVSRNILLYSCSWLVTRDLYRRTVYDNIALYSMETFSKNGNFPMESFGNFLKLSRPNSEVGSFRSLASTEPTARVDLVDTLFDHRRRTRSGDRRGCQAGRDDVYALPGTT